MLVGALGLWRTSAVVFTHDKCGQRAGGDRVPARAVLESHRLHCAWYLARDCRWGNCHVGRSQTSAQCGVLAVSHLRLGLRGHWIEPGRNREWRSAGDFSLHQGTLHHVLDPWDRVADRGALARSPHAAASWLAKPDLRQCLACRGHTRRGVCLAWPVVRRARATDRWGDLLRVVCRHVGEAHWSRPETAPGDGSTRELTAPRNGRPRGVTL